MTLNAIRKWNQSIIVALGVLCLPLPALHAAEPGTTTGVIEEYKESYPAYGVAESVRAGDFIFIGGIVAEDKDGNVIAPNDGKVQAEIVYGHIKKILEAHGASFRNVVSETIWVTDWPRYFEHAAPVRKRHYDEVGAAYSSAAGGKVVELSSPGWVLEVQVVAYVGETKYVDSEIAVNSPSKKK